MNELKNKHYIQYDYKCRDAQSPVYYNEKYKQEVVGVGSNIKKTTDYIIHNVKPGDTVNSLALKYYNNPTYWWMIVQFNMIFDPFMQLSDRYKTLKIPNMSTVAFGDTR